MAFARAFLTVVVLGCVTNAFALDHSRHVVVVVWDGMRPDFVSRSYTPTLFELAQRGVFFTNHHAVYLSSTEVNATALATGCYPDHNGIIGNEEYRPEIDPLRACRSDAFEIVRQADASTSRHYVQRPTLPELIRSAGGRTIVAGAKPVTLLADRAPRSSAADGISLFNGATLPSDYIRQITNRCGRFPISNETNSLRNDWTTQALVDVLWADGVPEFSLLWMNQPDFAQHTMGPGSQPVLACLRDLDRNLAQVLHALEAKGVSASTDIFVVSDHGFSTISARADLARDLQAAGFKAVREFPTGPTAGEILVVSNGATCFLYVIGHEHNLIRQLVHFLQGWRFAGVIFSSKAMPGTFPLKQVDLASANVPDLLVSLRWTPDNSTNGTPGLVVCDTGYRPGQGTHGSLSPFEMHNLLIAAGPDFRVGLLDNSPTGNVDLAPTVLWLLSISPPRAMDGRVLTEALTRKGPRVQRTKRYHLETKAASSGKIWRQYLNFTELNGVVYNEEGNGYQNAD
jgi:arylsulfatase A-like enzyme